MSATPDFLTPKEDHDDDHVVERAAHWVVIALLGAIAIAGLLNVFGERPAPTKEAGTPITASVARQ